MLCRLRSLLSLGGLWALICAGPVFAAGPAIGLVESDDPGFVADVQTKLMATGRFSTVDIIDASSVTPSVAQLQAYRAVLVWSNSGFADSVTLGNNLDTYLRGGGGVIIAVFANTDPGILDLRGAFATNGDFPMTVASQSSGTELTLGTVHVPGSPLLSGVTTFDGGTSSYYDPGTLTPGSVDVADWSNGTPLVATRLVNDSLVVLLNFFPPSSDARGDFWVATTSGTQLMVNALFNAGTQRVVLTPGVPSLAGWAMAMLAALLLGVGMWRLRRA